MAKKTKQQRIDELENAIKNMLKKVKFGLLSQVKRNDRNPVELATNVGQNVIQIGQEALDA